MDTELKINEVEVKPHELKVSVNVKEINKRIENIHRYLNSHKEYLNRLNVFPVPDGDTGLNLTLTFQGAMASMQGMENESMLPGEYLKNFTEQMLLNSRGCSGVIFSLFAQGVAQVLENNDFSNENLHRAIANGFKNAWDGTENPREGTMLTLMREFRDIFGKYIQEEKNAAMVISKSIPYLMEVLDRTPEMLPVLKQAGVVDSGGAGFIIILQGIDRELKHNGSGFNSLSIATLLNISRTTRKLLLMRKSHVRKSSLTPLITNIDDSKIHNSRLREILQNARKVINTWNGSRKLPGQEKVISDLEEMGNLWDSDIKLKYCTEFVLEANAINSKEELREIIGHYGDSLIIVNSGNRYKVHIHTNKPDAVFADAGRYGELVFTKVDDMKKQHRNFVSDDVIEYERDKSILCIVSGSGFADILKNFGADDVLCYGKNKPSVNQLVKKIDGLKAKNVIAAADDSDILMAVKYAVSLCKSNVYIVESNNPISIIAMMLGISKEFDIATMFESAMSNLNSITYCEIARSVRNVEADGFTVKKRDFFAVHNKKIIISRTNLEQLVVDVVEKLNPGASLVTIYKGIPSRSDRSLLPILREKFPNLEFEEYYGGQSKFNYYISFE